MKNKGNSGKKGGFNDGSDNDNERNDEDEKTKNDRVFFYQIFRGVFDNRRAAMGRR